MTKQLIEIILKNHGIPYYINNGRVYADDMESYSEPFENVTDVTDFTTEQLKTWLGY